jgi:hypothetical protein
MNLERLRNSLGRSSTARQTRRLGVIFVPSVNGISHSPKPRTGRPCPADNHASSCSRGRSTSSSSKRFGRVAKDGKARRLGRGLYDVRRAPSWSATPPGTRSDYHSRSPSHSAVNFTGAIVQSRRGDELRGIASPEELSVAALTDRGLDHDVSAPATILLRWRDHNVRHDAALITGVPARAYVVRRRDLHLKL